MAMSVIRSILSKSRMRQSVLRDLAWLLNATRLEAVVEVETGESVNHLEALAEWAGLHPDKAFKTVSMQDIPEELPLVADIAVTEASEIGRLA